MAPKKVPEVYLSFFDMGLAFPPVVGDRVGFEYDAESGQVHAPPPPPFDAHRFFLRCSRPLVGVASDLWRPAAHTFFILCTHTWWGAKVRLDAAFCAGAAAGGGGGGGPGGAVHVPCGEPRDDGGGATAAAVLGSPAAGLAAADGERNGHARHAPAITTARRVS
jgi:hypothetical protein